VAPVSAGEPWLIATPVTITEPVEVGDIVVVGDGSLTVTGVGEPGFRLRGNLWAIGTGRVILQDSVVKVLSSFHGQFAVAAGDTATVTVRRCTYTVPAGVQHALVASGSSSVVVEDSDFDFVQLLATGNGRMSAARLNGRFEVLLQDEAEVDLADVPRDAGRGDLWVWPEFATGARAVYSPPLPGVVASFEFPPDGATGIPQRFRIDRCRVALWPMLVQPGVELMLRDIAPENWVIVGLWASESLTVSRLLNGATYEAATLPLEDRTIRLERATIDTWNLYATGTSRLEIADCWLGEVLAFEDARVTLRRTVVDGGGGYFGATDRATVEAEECLLTCDVQATGTATVTLRRCQVRPYPWDSGGTQTRLGAYGDGRLLLDHSPFTSTPELAGRGVIGVFALVDPPAAPPRAGQAIELRGTIALYSLDPEVVPGRWRLEAVPSGGGATVLAAGDGNVENGALATWAGTDHLRDWELRAEMTDRLDRTLMGRWPVPRAHVVRRHLQQR
jgi:hypothetical protein